MRYVKQVGRWRKLIINAIRAVFKKKAAEHCPVGQGNEKIPNELKPDCPGVKKGNYFGGYMRIDPITLKMTKVDSPYRTGRY